MPARPTSIADKKAAGSYRPGTHGTAEVPEGVLGRPDAPASLMLNLTALQVFNDTCDMMDAAGWLRASDGPTIHAYSVLYAQLLDNPESYRAADYAQLRLYCAELGFSPAGRAKMPRKQKDDKPQNPFGSI